MAGFETIRMLRDRGPPRTLADLRNDLSPTWTVFTPTVTAFTGAFTTVSGAGRYQQIGKTVFVTLTVTITTNGTAAAYVVATLPVAVSASAKAVLNGLVVSNGSQVWGRINGTTSVLIGRYDNAYPGADGIVIDISGFYEAA